MIEKICIISPNPKSLLQRFEDCAQSITVLLFECNINNRQEAFTATGFLRNHKPDYVLIGLNEFDPENCIPVLEVSLFLEEGKIPAHFLLAEALDVHVVTAQEWSLKTGIRDLWSCPLQGKEFFEYILNQSSIYRIPEFTRSASASGNSGPDNDFRTPYIM